MNGTCKSSIGETASSAGIGRCALGRLASASGGDRDGTLNVVATDVSEEQYEQARRDAGLAPLYRALEWPAFEDRYDEEADANSVVREVL